jgi:transcriptional regulator with PAS, ATPase and Fis domain
VKGQYVGRFPEVGQLVLPVLAGGPHDSQETVLHRAGREFSCSASLLREDSGSIIGAIVVFHEVEHLPVKRMAAPLPHLYTFDEIVSDSPKMAAAKQWARIVAPSPFTVLLCGETGTGKELFAQAIHSASSRCNGPFIPINCSAIPEGLIESELFGYDEGAFTGAKKGGLSGKFEAADHGTIFLDEIGDMPLALQTRLLRVIQEGKVVRIGAVKEHDVDVRIIAATHRDLKAEVKRGTFREDLYYRLNGLTVRIPPLRERSEDIPELARRLVLRIAGKFNRKAFEIDNGFIAKLRLHTWPGNVREMENAIEGAILRCDENGSLTAALLDLSADAIDPIVPQPFSSVPVLPENSLRDTERMLIYNTLMSFHGNVRKTAAKLGIGRNTLYRKMKAFAIPRVE